MNPEITMIKAVVESATTLPPQHRRRILAALLGEPEKSRLITSKEACEILGISKPTLSDWAKKGRITPIRRSARSIRYAAAEVERLAREGDPRLGSNEAAIAQREG